MFNTFQVLFPTITKASFYTPTSFSYLSDPPSGG